MDRVILSAANDGSALRRYRWFARVQISHDRSIVCSALLIAILGFCFGEKIPVGNGFGWDGQFYGALAKNLTAEIQENPLNQYTVQRILPSVLVHLGLRATCCSLTDVNVIRGFGLLNIICVTAVAWLWLRIAALLAIGPRGRWLGLCALVLNFAVAKHAAFYPVLTDIPAYAIGCGMLYFYLRRHTGGLYLLTLLGAFTWPTLLLQGLVLLLFPREQGPVERIQTCPSRWSYLAAGLTAYYFLLAVNWSLKTAHLPICGYITPLQAALPASLAIAAAYLFFVVLRMCDVGLYTRGIGILLRQDWRRVLGVIALFATIKLVSGMLGPEPGRSCIQTYLMSLSIKSVCQPGAFLVGHAVYFGPIVPLAIVLWNRVSTAVRQVGAGLALAIAMALLHGIDGESRHLIYAFPLIVPFVVQAHESLGLNRWSYLCFALLSLVGSKVWFTINLPPLIDTGSLLEYPGQNYAMHYGVFMTLPNYMIQGAIMLAVTLAMYEFWYRASRTAAAEAKPRLQIAHERAAQEALSRIPGGRFSIVCTAEDCPLDIGRLADEYTCSQSSPKSCSVFTA